MPGDPVRRRRDPIDGRSVAGERPHRTLAGGDRPGLDRQRDARDDLAAGDSLDAPLPSAHHPGRAEAEREPVLRVRDRRAAADANGSRARQRRDRRREREHADAPEANRRRSDLRRESPAPGARQAEHDPEAARRDPGGAEAKRCAARRPRAHGRRAPRRRPDYECRPPRRADAKRSRRRRQVRVRCRERQNDREQGRHARQCITETVLLATAFVTHESSTCAARRAGRPAPVRPLRAGSCRSALSSAAALRSCGSAASSRARPSRLSEIRCERWSAGLGVRSSSPRLSSRRSASASVVSGTPISAASAVGVIGSTVAIRLRSASCSPLTPASCRCRATTRSAMCAAVQSRRKTDGAVSLSRRTRP